MKIAALFLLLPVMMFGQELPDAPHKFLDKTSLGSFTGSAAILSADATITCQNLGHNGFHEEWLPANSCAGVSSWIAASFASQLTTSYLLHRSGHHRMERFAEILWPIGSAVGIGYTLAHTRDSAVRRAVHSHR
jgi:hypothetical protein